MPIHQYCQASTNLEIKYQSIAYLPIPKKSSNPLTISQSIANRPNWHALTLVLSIPTEDNPVSNLGTGVQMRIDHRFQRRTLTGAPIHDVNPKQIHCQSNLSIHCKSINQMPNLYQFHHQSSSKLQTLCQSHENLPI